MANREGPTFFDHVLERALYPNINGVTPGPIAGRAMQEARELKAKQSTTNAFSYGLAGLPNLTVSPARPHHERKTDINELGPNEGRGFGLTTREQQVLSAVGVVTLVYVSSLLLRAKK